MKRRTFVKHSSEIAGGLALLPLLPGPKGSSNQDYPIIDTHQHLWDLDLFPLAWVRAPLDQSFLMEDYQRAIEGQNVVSAIYMEVNVPVEQRKEEALWALDLCRDPGNPTEAAVIRADPSDSDFEYFIRSFAENPYLKGVRGSVGNEEVMRSAKLIQNLKLLGEMGLSFDLNLPSKRLRQGMDLMDKCPDTLFILNHCGNADPMAFFPIEKETPREPQHDRDKWMRDIEDLSMRKNSVCKISGIVDNVSNYPLVAADLAPIVNHCYDAFGPDRIIFASDWPVCLRNMPLSKWIDILKDVVKERPGDEQKKLFHDNAKRLYEI